MTEADRYETDEPHERTPTVTTAKPATLPIEVVGATDLIPHPENPRRGDVKAIREAIERNGWHGALVAQRSTHHILAGNHRYIAGGELGMTEFPVYWVDTDDETARRILLADNRTADLATYDDRALLMILQSVPDPAGTGYTQTSIEDLAKALEGGEAAEWSVRGTKELDRQRWATVDIRQITLILNREEFEFAVRTLQAVMEAETIEPATNTGAVLWLLTRYAEARKAATE